MSTVELVCIDVDGTLLGSSGEVPPAVWAGVQRVRESGIHVAICSGRPAFGVTLEYARRIDADGWHIFQNGSSVVCPMTGKALSSGIAPDIVARIVKRREETGRVLELYTDHTYAVEQDDDRARRHAALLGVPFAPRPYSSLQGAIVRAQWLIPHEARETVLGEPHEGLTFCPSLSPIMADTTFVNMTAEGVSKGSALESIAADYGIPLDRVMMVGDSENDLPAMRVAGVPVAMGNAEPDVLQAARYTVGHVDEGGLLEALAIALPELC